MDYSNEKLTITVREPDLKDYPQADRAPLSNLIRTLSALRFPIMPSETKVHATDAEFYTVVSRWPMNTSFELSQMEAVFKINPLMIKNIYITCTQLQGNTEFSVNLCVELLKFSHYSSSSSYEIRLVQTRLEKVADFHSDLNDGGSDPMSTATPSESSALATKRSRQ